MKFFILNETAIKKHNLVDRMGRSQEELMDIIEADKKTKHIRYIYVDERQVRKRKQTH